MLPLPVQDGKRLGRGKGYYDSYLQQIKDKGLTTRTIGELATAGAHWSFTCGQCWFMFHMSSPCLPGPDV